MRVRTRSHQPHAFSHDHASEWEEDLFSVFNGGIERARVGRIPRFLAKAIGASTTIVQLSKVTAKKIRTKHPKVRFSDIAHLPMVFDGGDVARDTPLSLAFWFQSPAQRTMTMQAVIKSTHQGHEIYLKSVYPIAKHRLKALRAKAITLREAKSE